MFGSGSRKLLNTDLIRIRIHNTALGLRANGARQQFDSESLTELPIIRYLLKSVTFKASYKKKSNHDLKNYLAAPHYTPSHPGVHHCCCRKSR